MMTDPSPTDLPRGHQYPNEAGRPVADPSALTVAMIDKAISQLREFYDSKLAEKDKAVDLLHDDMVRFPTQFDREITCLKDLLESEIKSSMAIRDEKFGAVDKQFEALSLRAKDLDEARATALIAALAAAKELVGAANTNFTKQIDGLQTAFTGQIKALDEKVNDLRDRLTQLSSSTQGGVDAQVRHRADIGPISGVIAAGVAVLVLLGGIAVFVISRPPPSVVQYLPAPTTSSVTAPAAQR